MRFDSLTENESFGELQQRSPWLAGLIERVERESGGTLADVARVTLSSRAGEQPLLAIEFRGPVSLEQRLRARCNSEPYRREAIGNVAFFAPQGRAAAWRTAFAQPNETTILAGPPRILADVMARSRTAILSPAMSDVIERLDYSLPLAAAFDLHDASDSPDALGSRTCFGVPRAMLRPISAIGVACSLNRDAAINARLVCDDPAAAADFATLGELRPRNRLSNGAGRGDRFRPGGRDDGGVGFRRGARALVGFTRAVFWPDRRASPRVGRRDGDGALIGASGPIGTPVVIATSGSFQSRTEASAPPVTAYFKLGDTATAFTAP